MHESLLMPLSERLRRYRALRACVWETTASKYCATFMSYLEQEERPVPRGSGWRSHHSVAQS